MRNKLFFVCVLIAASLMTSSAGTEKPETQKPSLAWSDEFDGAAGTAVPMSGADAGATFAGAGSTLGAAAGAAGMAGGAAKFVTGRRSGSAKPLGWKPLGGAEGWNAPGWNPEGWKPVGCDGGTGGSNACGWNEAGAAGGVLMSSSVATEPEGTWPNSLAGSADLGGAKPVCASSAKAVPAE